MTSTTALAASMKPLQGGSIYAAYKHIDLYKRTGDLPNIHKSMGEAMKFVPQEQRGGAIDFGACHGLLSIRAKKMGWRFVIGMEMDEASVAAYNQFVRTPGVELQTGALDVRADSFRLQCREWAGMGINTFLARRVLSELFATTYGREGALKRDEAGKRIWMHAGHRFGEAARDAGLQWMVLEGRAFGPYKDRATHPIPNTDTEIEAIGPSWQVVHRYKEAVVMKPAA